MRERQKIMGLINEQKRCTLRTYVLNGIIFVQRSEMTKSEVLGRTRTPHDKFFLTNFIPGRLYTFSMGNNLE